MSPDRELEAAKKHGRGLARRMTDAGFHLDVGAARVRAAAALVVRAASELRASAVAPRSVTQATELMEALCDELVRAGASVDAARESLKGEGRRPTHSPSDWDAARSADVRST